MHWQECYKKYLGHWSFDNGDETLTIKKVGIEEVYDNKKGTKKDMVAIWFAEKELPALMNITNCKTIEEVTGTSVIDDWVGKKIVVGVRRVNNGPNVTDAIRVQTSKPDDDVIFCDDCGSIITPAGGKQPSELAEISRRNIGRTLCVKCMKKAKDLGEKNND